MAFTTFDIENAKQVRPRVPATIKPGEYTFEHLNGYADFVRYSDNIDNLETADKPLAPVKLGFPLDGTARAYDRTSPTGYGYIPQSGRKLTWNYDGGVTMRVRGRGKIGNTAINSPTFVNVYKSNYNGNNTLVSGDLLICGVFRGLALYATENDITDVSMALRCCDSVRDNSWQVSTCTVSMMYLGDIKDGDISLVKEMAPVDISFGSSDEDILDTKRRFYFRGNQTYLDGILTLEFVDRSSMFADCDVASKYHRYQAKNYPTKLYETWGNTIEEALEDGDGQRPAITYETAPTAYGDSTTYFPLVVKGETMNNWVANWMNFGRYRRSLIDNQGFFFVDAGRPHIFHTAYATTARTVDKADLANITQSFERAVGRIRSSEQGLWIGHESGESAEKSLATIDATNGKRYGVSFNRYSRITSNSYCTVTEEYADGAVLKATHTGSIGVRGNEMVIENTEKTISATDHAGGRIDIDPPFVGKVQLAGGLLGGIFPHYWQACVPRRTVLEFDYKGDPRWQPMDTLTIGETQYLIKEIDLTYDGALKSHVKVRRL